MPGIQGEGRRGPHIGDDRGGTEFQGGTAGMGALPGLREVTRKGITGGAPPNLAQHGKRGVGAVG